MPPHNKKNKPNLMKRTIITLLLTCYLPTFYLLANDTETRRNMGTRLADSFDLGVTLGTTGIGLEVSASPSDLFRVRAGVDYMPRFNVPLYFNLDSYRDGALAETDFSELQDMMKKISGFDVDQEIKMDCHAKMVNFKMMLDIFPLRNNKHWYATVGFFWGTSHIGTARNAMEEMHSLLAIGMYNNMHDYVLETDFIENPIYEDIYLDPDVADRLKEKMERNGRIGMHVGNYADGRPYMMEPGSDGMVKADLIVNNFRPYLGLGYVTSLDKDKHINIGVDGGVMFWGGTPKVVTHENVNLTEDVSDIAGKVGSYVRTVRDMKVYPVLNFRIAYRFGK